MSISSLGIIGGLAAAQTAGIKSASTERTLQDVADQAHEVDSEQKAEKSSGVEQTDQEQQTADRDADGRRLWEAPAKRSKAGKPADLATQPDSEPPGKDATGDVGGHLDLSG